MALRDEIRAAAASAKTAVIPVPTPELPQWDGRIGVTPASLHAIAAGWQDADANDALDERATFVVRVACDMDGCKIWDDGDILWLSTTPFMAPIVERLYHAGRHVCGLTEENRTAWRKNLPGTGDVGSPSSCAEQSTPAMAST